MEKKKKGVACYLPFASVLRMMLRKRVACNYNHFSVSEIQKVRIITVKEFDPLLLQCLLIIDHTNTISLN